MSAPVVRAHSTPPHCSSPLSELDLCCAFQSSTAMSMSFEAAKGHPFTTREQLDAALGSPVQPRMWTDEQVTSAMVIMQQHNLQQAGEPYSRVQAEAHERQQVPPELGPATAAAAVRIVNDVPFTAASFAVHLTPEREAALKNYADQIRSKAQ